MAARKNRRMVTMRDFEDAKDKVDDGRRAPVHGHDRGRGRS